MSDTRDVYDLSNRSQSKRLDHSSKEKVLFQLKTRETTPANNVGRPNKHHNTNLIKKYK